MVNVELLSLSIANFRGIKKANINFLPTKNIIIAPSGEGKTTLYNAYLWALGFLTQKWEPTLNGNKILGLETSVEISLKKNNQFECKFKKVNTPLVNLEKQNQENKLNYYVNGNLVTATDYKEMLCKFFELDYLTLELLSDLSLFNSEKGTHWNTNKRKSFLGDLFSTNEKIDALKNEDEFSSIKDLISQFSDEDAKSNINQSIKNIKKEQEINLRLIEEKQKEIEEYSKIDFEKLKDDLQRVDIRLKELENTASNIEIECPNCHTKISKTINGIQNEDTIKEKKELAEIYTNLKLQSEKENIVLQLQNKISEIKASSRTLETEKVEILKKKDVLNQFIREKNVVLENCVNSYFDGIKFIFFKQGSLNSIESDVVCISSLEGIEYDLLSDGEKVFANKKINDTLQRICKVCVPVFVDKLSTNSAFKNQLINDNLKVNKQEIYLINDINNSNFQCEKINGGKWNEN